VAHGLDGITGEVDIPADTVVHQLPVELPDGQRGVVIRVYGVEDDAKLSEERGNATWCGRPLLEAVQALGLSADEVWPGLSREAWTLWNARLFPVATADEAWTCARWMLGTSQDYSVAQWRARERFVVGQRRAVGRRTELEAARSRRLQATWRILALSLVDSGADIRPLLANAPGIAALSDTGTALCARAKELEGASPTEAASRYYAANLFFGQAGCGTRLTRRAPLPSSWWSRQCGRAPARARARRRGRWVANAVTV
jgi:hypothetical protein